MPDQPSGDFSAGESHHPVFTQAPDLAVPALRDPVDYLGRSICHPDVRECAFRLTEQPADELVVDQQLGLGLVRHTSTIVRAGIHRVGMLAYLLFSVVVCGKSNEGSPVYATERQEHIERKLAAAGRVSVVELARSFDVTTETVRRDLDQLEQAGALRRVHGGAVPLERGSTVEASLPERRQLHGVAKSAIAARALDALGEGFRGSVFLDAGTTTAAIAGLLATRLAGASIDIVTHALPLAFVLAEVEQASLTVIGGRVRGLTAAAVGADTVRAIGTLRPDVAFIGTNGVSAEFGLSTPDPDEAAVKTAIVRAARRVVVVADSHKLGNERLVSFASLSDIDVLVTDAAPDAELAAALADADVEVWIA